MNIVTMSSKGAPSFRVKPPDGISLKPWTPARTKDWMSVIDKAFTGLSASIVFDEEFSSKHVMLRKRMVIAYSRKQAVGVGALWAGTAGYRIHWLGVVPEFQRKGIGSAIMSKLFEIYELERLNGDIYLHANEDQVPFFEAVGMEVVK